MTVIKVVTKEQSVVSVWVADLNSEVGGYRVAVYSTLGQGSEDNHPQYLDIKKGELKDRGLTDPFMTSLSYVHIYISIARILAI